MKDLHSGLDAWRYIITSESERRTVASYLPLILSAAGVLGVFPFMVLRYMQGEWVAAIEANPPADAPRCTAVAKTQAFCF